MTPYAKRPAPDLELWGGVECTVNRVGDVYYDQLARSGHAARVADLDDFAALGIRAIRYPLLWERLAPSATAEIDWSWSDRRLERLRELGVRVIAGLTHHGCGPRHTSLIEPSFVDGLADFAGKVAERYPWIDAYTPVNEPLTTARFSGLYGLWYPHGRDDATFARAVTVQCRAVSAAMAAIRRVKPDAALVQTEDLGRTYSTPALASVAAFYNHRRWLSLDLLCGKVVPGHPMYERLLEWGVSEADLSWQEVHASTPDIIGINHYLTSDRYLDEAVDDYEPREHGATPEGLPYADVEAVRASLECSVDPKGVLEEAWARYGVPVALTEIHLGATRDEQMRWLHECWNTAQAARTAGVDVRAVTVWSLLGSFDWNVLVTSEGHCYEPGPLDVRSTPPRRTALARLMCDLAAGRDRGDDPVLSSQGWWRRAERLHRSRMRGRASAPGGQAPGVEVPHAHPSVERDRRLVRPVLILGGGSALGETFERACAMRGLPYRSVSERPSRPGASAAIEDLVADCRPWAVIDASDDEPDSRRPSPVGGEWSGLAGLATACIRQGSRLACFSSDAVFDGCGPRAAGFVETDAIDPASAYGCDKADMESRVLHAWSGALVVRTGAVFGPFHRGPVPSRLLDGLVQGEPAVASDTIRTFSYAPDLVDAVLDLLIDEEHGIWHLVNAGSTSDAIFATRLAELAGGPSHVSTAMPTAVLERQFLGRPRPALSSVRGMVLPRIEDAMVRYVRDSAGQGTSESLVTAWRDRSVSGRALPVCP